MKTPSSANSKLESLVYQLILRENVLTTALRRAASLTASVSEKDFESLRKDLEANQEFLQHCSTGNFFPAAAALSSPKLRAWEQSLTDIFRDTTCRWNRVFTTVQELSEILERLDQILALLPDTKSVLGRHRERIAAHKFFHERVLARWVETERQRGNPIHSLIEAESLKREKDWEGVVEELLESGNSPYAIIPSFSWRSMERAAKLIVERLTHLVLPGEDQQAA